MERFVGHHLVPRCSKETRTSQVEMPAPAANQLSNDAISRVVGNARRKWPERPC
jgi:hypothetical protein